LPHHEVIATMSAADILLVPSVPMGNWVEAQGCVLQEAMLVGTMIIASDIGGVAESIPREMHDCLVPPSEPAAIAAAVHRLARMPIQERQSRARVNRAFCETRYDIRALNRRMLARALVDPGSAPDDAASPITAPHAPRRSR
jgi:glycosyltransferase involved in cell wall biosynthesis